jgi:hypothetical protein
MASCYSRHMKTTNQTKTTIMTLAQWLKDNTGDFYEWLVVAEIGNVFPTFVECQRIA